MALVADRFAFFHCPRTAGTWTRNAIEHLGIPCREISPFHAWPAVCDVGERVTFTLRREPLAWLQSWYRMLKIRHTGRHGDFTEMHPLLLFRDYRLQTFTAFVEDILAKSPGIVSRIFAVYSEGVDFIGETQMPHHALERILFATDWYETRCPVNITSRREAILMLLGQSVANATPFNVRQNIETVLPASLEQAFRQSEAKHVSTQKTG